MPNSTISPFSFDSHEVRTSLDENQNPWFCAKDVCAVLDITWSGATLSDMPENWKLMLKLNTTFGEKDTNFINEAGFFNLVFRSNKPNAKDFANHVCSEVLPGIRKNGFYFGQNSAFSQLQNLLNPKAEPLILAEFDVLKDDLKSVTDLLIYESLKNIPVLLSASDLVARNTKPREKLERIGGSHETRPKRWTQADYDKIRELREQEYTVQQIADAIGRTKMATQYRISMMIRGEV